MMTYPDSTIRKPLPALALLLLLSCGDPSKEETKQDMVAVPLEDISFPEDTAAPEKPFVASYTWGIDSNSIVAVKREAYEPDSVIFISLQKGVVRIEENGKIIKDKKVEFIRDRAYQLHRIVPGYHYIFENGLLYVEFEGTQLLYDYSFMSSKNKDWQFSRPVHIRFKRGEYCKGSNFVRFATIDTIYTNEGADLSLFIGTDVEIDEEINCFDKKTLATFYEGTLVYDHEEGTSQDKWYRRNFRFIRAKTD